MATPKPVTIERFIKVYPLAVMFLKAADGRVNGKMFAKYCK